MKRIPFVEEMREAVRADWKTQTRRIGKCPYRVEDVLGIGEPHRLWVEQRPTFRSLGPRHGELEYAGIDALRCEYEDGEIRELPLSRDEEAAWLAKVTVGLLRRCDEAFQRPPRRRSGRFLPDAFVRDRVRITAIRREPLQSITPEDACREGCPELSGSEAFYVHGRQAYVRWFAALWDSLHWKIPGERWRDNPEVTVLTFAREIGS
jgi:hypothetical protein